MSIRIISKKGKEVDWKMTRLTSQLTSNPTKQLTLTHILLIHFFLHNFNWLVSSWNLSTVFSVKKHMEVLRYPGHFILCVASFPLVLVTSWEQSKFMEHVSICWKRGNHGIILWYTYLMFVYLYWKTGVIHIVYRYDIHFSSFCIHSTLFYL